jgi:hypothetical protein
MYRSYRKPTGIFIIVILVCSMLTGCIQQDTSAAVNDTASAPAKDAVLIPAAASKLRQDNIMKTIKELSSEQYEGRLTGTKANSMVAEYIADYFKEIGLENPKGLDNYMQAYMQPTVELMGKPVLQVIDKNEKVIDDFNYAENFVLRRLSSETNEIDMEAAMCLIENPEMLRKNNEKLKGKVILLPWKYYNLLGGQNEPADFAEMFDASAIISEFDLSENQLGYNYLKVRPLPNTGKLSKDYKPFAFVDSGTFSKLKEGARVGNKLHFSCNSNVIPKNSVTNVIGLIPGSDPKLKEKHIIIGAHFDHVGNNMNGTYNPGALDNASGTAVMLELARVIKESKTPLKQSILFIALNGEEGGLLGAKAYCKNPVSPLNKAVMINLDMVGSASKIPLTIAAASKESNKSLRDDLAEYADKLNIVYNKEYEGASDHAVFDKYGVPSVCLINMDLGYGYHSSHDTMEAVDGARTLEIAELVLNYINSNIY